MTAILFSAALVFVPLALLIMLLVRGGVSIRASLDVGPVRALPRETMRETMREKSDDAPAKPKRERTNTGIAPAARGKKAPAQDPAQSYTTPHPPPDSAHPHAMGTWSTWSTETPAMPTVITRDVRDTRGDS